MYKFCFLPLLGSMLLLCCKSQKTAENPTNQEVAESYEVRSDFKQFFTDCPDRGSIVIYDDTKQQWIVSDTTSTKKETLPASTFKIINFLIALETGVIQDENSIVKWITDYDTTKYGHRPDIYHDMTIEEAFKQSAGWAFVELAKKIGRTNYQKYLSASNYGNLVLTQEDADFWNFGDFGITPINQIQFLRNFYAEKLPFSKRNIQLVKRVMISEQNDNYTISSKTGWTRDGGIHTGWWVGYVDSPKGTYFFATRLLRARSERSGNFGNCRKEITKKVLRQLGVL